MCSLGLQHVVEEVQGSLCLCCRRRWRQWWSKVVNFGNNSTKYDLAQIMPNPLDMNTIETTTDLQPSTGNQVDFINKRIAHEAPLCGYVLLCLELQGAQACQVQRRLL